MDSHLKSTREFVIPRAKESFLEKRPDGSHQKEKFIRHIALKTPGDVLRLEDIAKETRGEADCALQAWYLLVLAIILLGIMTKSVWQVPKRLRYKNPTYIYLRKNL